MLNKFNPLKLKVTSDSNCWFSADLHYNHEKLAATRGCSSVEEMNEQIINNWNKVVTNNDVCFLIGDTVFNDSKGDLTYYLFNKLNFKTLYAQKGNHNSGIKQVFKDHDVYCPDRGGAEVIFAGDYLEAWINKTPVVMFHYPISVWNYMSSGSICLVGHSHGSFYPSTEACKDAKILDCGYDIWKRPIDFAQARAIMDTKGIQKLDHHI